MSGLDGVIGALETLAMKLDENRRETVDAGDFRDLLRLVMQQQHTIAELHHRAENTFRWGVVEEVDAEKGYGITFGMDADGKPLPSDWIPHPEQGGAFKSWRPSSKGQIVGVLCPNGDQRQAIMFPKGGFSDDNPPPSDKLDENVETYGKVRTTWKEESTEKKVGEHVSVTTTTERHAAKTEKAGHATEADRVVAEAGNTKLATLQDRNVSDATRTVVRQKLLVASGGMTA